MVFAALFFVPGLKYGAGGKIITVGAGFEPLFTQAAYFYFAFGPADVSLPVVISQLAAGTVAGANGAAGSAVRATTTNFRNGHRVTFQILFYVTPPQFVMSYILFENTSSLTHNPKGHNFVGKNYLKLATAILIGPLAFLSRRPALCMVALFTIIALTVITQVGGLILWLSWPVLAGLYKRTSKHKTLVSLAIFAAIYSIIIFTVVPWTASVFGRVPLPVFAGKAEPIRPVNFLYCFMARNYVRPEVKTLLVDVSVKMNRKYPGSELVYYDANFPFIDGFPLIPHLSHNDGKKVDLGFFYTDKSTGEPLGSPPSPIGYWVYEQPKAGEYQPCKNIKSRLRWDFDFIQPFFDYASLDKKRTTYLLKLLAESRQVQKILIEPHLKIRLGVGYNKIRFQGCQAARHDDHIHIQIR
jgi:hypothetical protein